MVTNKNGKAGRMWTPSVSLELATRISDGANITFLISLVVGLVSTCFIIVMANVKEAHWDRERQASNERIAELEKDTAEAELALEKFRAPRELTQDQQRQVVKQLKPFSGTAFNLSGLTNEQMFFALSIGDTLTEAGWTIDNWIGPGIKPAGRTFTIGTIPTWGVAIRINDPRDSAAGQALISALRLVGVEGVSLESTTDPNASPTRHVINIMVGDKQ